MRVFWVILIIVAIKVEVFASSLYEDTVTENSDLIPVNDSAYTQTPRNPASETYHLSPYVEPTENTRAVRKAPQKKIPRSRRDDSLFSDVDSEGNVIRRNKPNRRNYGDSDRQRLRIREGTR